VAQTENPGRERILARIQSALSTPAHRHSPKTESPRIFAPVSDLLERFQKECAGNNTECMVSPNYDGSATAITNVLASLPPGEIFVQDSPELRRMGNAWQEHRNIRWSSDGGPKETSQATISTTEALVAQTGSVLVSAACGGRGASVVAPVHIVVATAGELVPDLEKAFAQLQQRGTARQNSYLCLITGSSRTADIEKILVLGAHGPRRLIVALSLASE
jgi:L-lactate dehydrogenase complex protein LldG